MKTSFFLWFLTAATLISASGKAFAAEIPDTYTYKVGAFEVILLSEGQNERKSSLFVGADAELIKKYVPKGVYPAATNAFLIRTPDKVILVDAGYGTKLFESMNTFGVEASDVDAVFLTHMHGDHIGGLLREGKVAFPKAQLYLAEQERAYWTDLEFMKKLPEDKQGAFKKSQETLDAYGTSVQTFTPGQLPTETKTPLPGISALAAFGHTPGHTLYRVESDGEQLLIWGDLAHAMAIQMAEPQVAMTYDLDPQMAVASRKAVLQYVADAKIPVAGMHIPFPGIGKVTDAPEGGYLFTPMGE